jgi:hypothetical protein
VASKVKVTLPSEEMLEKQGPATPLLDPFDAAVEELKATSENKYCS